MRSLLESAEGALLLSIKPHYVALILEGEKLVELRRTRPRIKKGELVLIYESSPTMALVGYGLVETVISAPPSRLWPQVKSQAGVSRAEFELYFEGASTGFAIQFKKVWSLRNRVWLSKLREIWDGFHPPQTYLYLSKKQMDLVFNG